MFVVVFLIIGVESHPEVTPPGVATDSTILNRKIELVIRSQFSVPIDYAVAIGGRRPSPYAGFDTLSVTLSKQGKPTTVEFLISRDNARLARLEEFDLNGDLSPPIDTAGRPIRGNPEAPVTVVSFDDLECPFCARMHREIFPRMFERYKDTVRFIYKDNPITAIHPWAMRGAVDANCLAAQSADAYWQFVDFVHSRSGEINGDSKELTRSFALLDSEASEEGESYNLDSGRLKTCLQMQDETRVKTSVKEARSLHIEGTPSLIVNGERISGLVSAEQLQLVIDRALKAVGVHSPSEVEEKP
jgi:protein-disulfide isomerase